MILWRGFFFFLSIWIKKKVPYSSPQSGPFTHEFLIIFSRKKQSLTNLSGRPWCDKITDWYHLYTFSSRMVRDLLLSTQSKCTLGTGHCSSSLEVPRIWKEEVKAGLHRCSPLYNTSAFQEQCCDKFSYISVVTGHKGLEKRSPLFIWPILPELFLRHL